MKSKNEYSKSHVILLQVLPKSIQVRRFDDPNANPVWLGRSLLSYITDEELDRMGTPQDLEIEVMTWVLSKEGLL